MEKSETQARTPQVEVAAGAEDAAGGAGVGRTHPALSLRGMLIGSIGAAVITASSLYVALKLGALPWPIVFAALVSLFFLRLLGNTSLNEANVTHTAMSAGSMVAGGLAFTIPGFWILSGGNGATGGLGAESMGVGGIGFVQVLVVALAGVLLGLVATACVRPYFIERANLSFPIGISAAETLKASDKANSKEGKTLFAALGLGAVYGFLRDNLALLPAMFFDKVNLPGVAFGIYNSPMMLGVGFIVGPVACLVWFLGALVGDMGIVVAGSSLGWWDMESASGIKLSLGMGLMLGAGVGVVVLQLATTLLKRGKGKPVASDVAEASEILAGETGVLEAPESKPGTRESPEGKPTVLETPQGKRERRALFVAAPLVSAAVVGLAAWILGLGLLPSIFLVLGAWIAVLMSAQSVGVSGIDPMEVFGVLVLLVIQLFFHEMSLESFFFIAAIVAVACGLTGDVMNDFKAGAILGTRPRDQWIAQAIGGVIGAVTASIVLFALVSVFGVESFGPGKEFVAAQASVVAALVGGVPQLPAFLSGIAAGLFLALLRLPCMTLGLGVYLPFYLSLTVFVGGLVKLVYERVAKGLKKRNADGIGIAVASGLLGGESLIGVLSALVLMVASFF